MHTVLSDLIEAHMDPDSASQWSAWLDELKPSIRNKLPPALARERIVQAVYLSTMTDKDGIGNWKLNNYLVGLGTISPLNNNEIEFYTKMMMGLCSGKSPSVQATLSDGNSDLVINQTSGDANNFAALFGLGFRIHAGESVDIMIAGDYFTSTLEYEDILVNLKV